MLLCFGEIVWICCPLVLMCEDNQPGSAFLHKECTCRSAGEWERKRGMHQHLCSLFFQKNLGVSRSPPATTCCWSSSVLQPAVWSWSWSSSSCWSTATTGTGTKSWRWSSARERELTASLSSGNCSFFFSWEPDRTLLHKPPFTLL